MENVESPSTNSNIINDNESQDSRIILAHSSDTSDTPVGNEVCPNTECKKINPGTTGTENTRTEVNGTTDGVGQT